MIYFYAILSALKEEIFLNNKINRQGEIITNNDGTTILQLSQLGFELCPLMLQSQALTLS
jgi:hypothetical protein